MTGIVDLETSRLWDMFEGRSKAALANRLRALGDAASAIEAVVIDPFAPYRAAVRELLPHAVHVADRLHRAPRQHCAQRHPPPTSKPAASS